MSKGTLYLIPVTLGDTPVDKVLPSANREVIASIKHFIVEDIRSARRFLKKSNPDIVIDNLTFYDEAGNSIPIVYTPGATAEGGAEEGGETAEGETAENSEASAESVAE